jgi:hypothetical protein
MFSTDFIFRQQENLVDNQKCWAGFRPLCNKILLLHFVAFFHVASLFSTGVDNKKVGVDNEKALEQDNRIIFSYFSLISM